MTGDIFIDWVKNHFKPDSEKYCKDKNLNFKILLLIDNAPLHPAFSLIDINENVQILFLPPNTTSLIQPLDQGIIRAFKALYIKRSFHLIHREIQNDPENYWIKCWKNFNIKDCINQIKSFHLRN